MSSPSANVAVSVVHPHSLAVATQLFGFPGHLYDADLIADLGSLSAQLVILGLAIGADIFALMRSEMFLFSPSRLTLMHR